MQLSTVDGTSPVLAASVRHFSWYGGAPEGNNCVDVYVKVVSAVDGTPLGNARVEASPGTVGVHRRHRERAGAQRRRQHGLRPTSPTRPASTSTAR